MEDKDAELIEVAISKALSNSDDYDSSDILTDWVIVTYVSNPDDEKSGYPMLFSNGIPPHKVVGLLNIGLEKTLRPKNPA